jgi:hypothetical protein
MVAQCVAVDLGRVEHGRGGDGGQSNYINQTQFDAESSTVANDYNSSVSWTTDARAWNAVRWNGSAVWVYGIAGGDAG